jgi:hypothetical protein
LVFYANPTSTNVRFPFSFVLDKLDGTTVTLDEAQDANVHEQEGGKLPAAISLGFDDI